MYSAFKIQVGHNHELFSYFDSLCFNAKNLYNVTNYYVRQVYTALKAKKINENQKLVLKEIDENLDKMNEVRLKSYGKALEKAKKSHKSSVVKEPKLVLFERPNQEKSMIWYEFTEALFKVMKQVDYKSLPAQANQQTMKKVFDDWKSFFNALKAYGNSPEKFLGIPRIPKYKPKNGRATCYLTDQITEIKEGNYLKLPGTKLQLHIGKVGLTAGKLQQVRIIPSYGRYEVELIFKSDDNEKAIKRTEMEKNLFVFKPKNVMGVDLGVDNLATIVDNMGNQPLLIKGKWLKSINQYYNKLRARYVSIIRNGMQKHEGAYTTERLTNLDRKRNNRTKDFLHKCSSNLVLVAQERKIDTIVIGKNEGWKREVDMKKSDKQTFIGIPFSTFIEMVRYKAERVGIQVVVREESYTSKSSFLHLDPLPVYGEKHETTFSGYRETRAFYKIKGTKQRIHADVNGAFNIIRKHVEGAFKSRDSRAILLSPKKLQLVTQKAKEEEIQKK